MNILDALAKLRPIRRVEWTNTAPGHARINHETPCAPQWITLGEKADGMVGRRHPWVIIATGKEITLTLKDYFATDWEAMP